MHNANNTTVPFYHALSVLEEVCIGCSRCMRVCPTEAIRVKDGKARINANKCVDCGECYKVCPVSAIVVKQDDLDQIFNYKRKVALIPAVFTAQFPENINRDLIYAALKEIGFTDIYEVENAVATIIRANQELNAESRQDNPAFISAFCPAVVRLIQVKFPDLVDKIIPVKPPVDIAALQVKKLLQKEGVQGIDIGLFYFTPCAAKIAAVKTPVGDDATRVNGVINMDLMYNKVLRILKHSGTEDNLNQTEFKGCHGAEWSLTKGESSYFEGRCLSIDGINNVIEFLEKVEDGDMNQIDYLELRACDESCAGGILVSENRFLTTERLREKVKAQKEKEIRSITEDEKYFAEHARLKPIKPRSIDPLDEDIAVAMEKMKKIRKILCFLPGFDCGACGAPGCQALAEDIVNNEANLSHCIFMQKVMEKNKKLSPEHSLNIIEKIWGKDRLDKNCNKKGAGDDSF